MVDLKKASIGLVVLLVLFWVLVPTGDPTDFLLAPLLSVLGLRVYLWLLGGVLLALYLTGYYRIVIQYVKQHWQLIGLSMLTFYLLGGSKLLK